MLLQRSTPRRPSGRARISRQQLADLADTGCMSRVQKQLAIDSHSPNDLAVIVNDETHTCGDIVVLCEEFDAFFCGSCDVWLESVCGDSSCPCCLGRPSMPSGVHLAGVPVDHR